MSASAYSNAMRQALPRLSVGAMLLAGTAMKAPRRTRCEPERRDGPAVTYDQWRRRVERMEDRAARAGRGLPGNVVVDHRPLKVYITGFGPFGSVKENPTSVMCRWLEKRKAALEKQGIETVGLDIVEVSAEAARAKAAEIAAALADAPGPRCVIHLGVAVNNPRLCLECRAVNLADFPIPDVRGWVAHNEPIVSGGPPHEYTALPLVELLCELRDVGADFEISTSAGTYICNYIYFQSLTKAAQSGVPVLFVHTPSFDTMSQEEQARSIEALLVALRRLADRGHL